MRRKSKSVKTLLSASAFLLLMLPFGCAHRPAGEEKVVTPAPMAPVSQAKTKIKYVYVDERSTSSGMTTASFEHPDAAKKTLSSEILQMFWPLLTLIVTGFVFIIVLLIEHVILRHQLATRAELKARLTV